MCIAILVLGCYVWANYLELEHYLLVPWLIVGIGAAVGLEAITEAVGFALSRAGLDRAGSRSNVSGVGVVGVVVGCVGLVLAGLLASTNWAAADRSGDTSGSDYVNTVMTSLPANAAILSEWDASTPLWHGQQVLGLRPDVIVVDDSNIVYEGWVTREKRIESLICERPVFILRLSDRDLVPTRQEFRVTPFITVGVAYGGPSSAAMRPIYRVEPLDPNACPGPG
jgi:hypothetical protein